MVSTPEGKVKKDFCSELRKMGCTVLQYKQDATTVKAFPDTIVLLPEALTIYLEFKAHKNSKYRPGQKEWGERLLKRNYFWWTVYDENADEVLDQIKALL